MENHIITPDKLQVRIEKIHGKVSLQLISHDGESDQDAGTPLINPKITIIVFNSLYEMGEIMSTIYFRIPKDISESEVYEYRIPTKQEI